MKYESLNNLYQKLFHNLKREKVSLKKDSIILTLTRSGSNIQSKISKILEESSVKSHFFKRDELKYFLDENHVRVSRNDLNDYVLTAKGLWFIETENKKISKKILVDFIESEILTKKINTKLKDKEKIILFALISLRCFDINNVMNLNDKYRLDEWLSIFSDCRDFLHSKKILKNKVVFKNVGLEHAVAAEMRRVNDLPKKTHLIYNFTGKKEYYLDISKNTDKVSQLMFLFGLVLDGNNDPTLLDEIKTFCNNLAYDKTKFVSDLTKLTKEYDDLIHSSIRSLILLHD